MTTKTISIMDDVHKLLVINKLKNESFSDVIRRNLNKKKNIMKFAGIWKNISNKNIKKIKEDIKNLRKHSTEELIKDDIRRF